MTTTAPLSPAVLSIDPAETASRIEASIRDIVQRQLRRRGVVVALSGGIDSSVVGVLAARALGPERVVGLLMPEADSSPDSRRLAEGLTRAFNIRSVVEDISGILESAGYRRRDSHPLGDAGAGEGYRSRSSCLICRWDIHLLGWLSERPLATSARV